MPAGISTSPRAVPGHSLIFKLRFSKPENKVTRVTLVFINNNNLTLTGSCLKLIKVEVCKLTIIRVSRNIIIKISASHISVPVSFNLFNQLNHVVNMFCGTANHIRVADIHRINIFHKSVGIKVGNFKNTLVALSRRFLHFIFTVVAIIRKVSNVSNIHYMLDFITEQRKSLIKNIKKNISTQISNMRIVVNRRTAAVKTNLSFNNRLKLFHFSSHSIV